MGMVSGVLDFLAEAGCSDCRGWKEAAWQIRWKVGCAEGTVGEAVLIIKARKHSEGLSGISCLCFGHIHLYQVWMINWRSKTCCPFRKSEFLRTRQGQWDDSKEGLNVRGTLAIDEVIWLWSSFSTLVSNVCMWGNGRGAVKDEIP